MLASSSLMLDPNRPGYQKILRITKVSSVLTGAPKRLHFPDQTASSIRLEASTSAMVLALS